ncbi:MAG: hypothetical protein KAS22_01930 [Candidatus Heimdallarchaeota archaeon]|nr:hypothetical protein [Candidatus Heimdallarchaeota archaeon]
MNSRSREGTGFQDQRRGPCFASSRRIYIPLTTLALFFLELFCIII